MDGADNGSKKYHLYSTQSTTQSTHLFKTGGWPTLLKIELISWDWMVKPVNTPTSTPSSHTYLIVDTTKISKLLG